MHWGRHFQLVLDDGDERTVVEFSDTRLAAHLDGRVWIADIVTVPCLNDRVRLLLTCLAHTRGIFSRCIIGLGTWRADIAMRCGIGATWRLGPRRGRGWHVSNCWAAWKGRQTLMCQSARLGHGANATSACRAD